MASTRDALIEQGALLYARCGTRGVSARELHEAAGAKNESALHYHFGSQDGLVLAIVQTHLDAVERRRRLIVDALEGSPQQPNVRQLVFALAAPMADDLEDPIGRAHLRIIGEVNHPSLGYDSPFPSGQTVAATAAPAGRRVIRWLQAVLSDLPARVAAERVAVLRSQLIDTFAARARLIDDDPSMSNEGNALFVNNLIDMIVAGLTAPPSPATLGLLAGSDGAAALSVDD